MKLLDKVADTPPLRTRRYLLLLNEKTRSLLSWCGLTVADLHRYID